MAEKEFKKYIKTAIESTKDVPEPFRTEAFKVILTHLLKSELRRKPTTRPKDGRKSAPEKEEVEIDFSTVPTFEEFFDWSWHDRYLFLLDWAEENHPEKGLTSGEIRRILDERFGFHSIESRMVAGKLKTHLVGTRNATRKPIGKRRYRWHITPYGHKYVEGLLEKVSEE